jgi:hypothetical protein
LCLKPEPDFFDLVLFCFLAGMRTMGMLDRIPQMQCNFTPAFNAALSLRTRRRQQARHASCGSTINFTSKEKQ